VLFGDWPGLERYFPAPDERREDTSRFKASRFSASIRADARLEAGGLDGYAGWKRVLRAVEVLQSAELGPEVQVH
jgi:hypothetical protein